MNRRVVIATILTSLMSAHPLLADLPTPTVLTVYFQKDGQPYKDRVKFTVHCYGWAAYPGDPGFPPGKKPDPYVPKKVYSFSGDCSGYGCQMVHDFYLNYLHIDFCSLEGRTRGKSFRIEKYGDQPFSRCEDPASRSLGKRGCELKVTLPK
jgi:hypothetical protein